MISSWIQAAKAGSINTARARLRRTADRLSYWRPAAAMQAWGRRPHPRLTDFRADGQVFLPDVIDREVLSSVRKRYEQLIDDDRYAKARAYPAARAKGLSFSRQLRHAPRDLPELQRVLAPSVIRLAGDYFGRVFGSHFAVHSAIAWRNYHVPGDVQASVETISDRWHFDAVSHLPEGMLQFFVALSDVGELDGPFQTLTIAQSNAIRQRGYRDRRSYASLQSEIEDPAKVRKLMGPMGVAALCNNRACLHRAGIPAQGHQRDMIEFVLIPAREPLSPDWFEKLPEDIRDE